MAATRSAADAGLGCSSAAPTASGRNGRKRLKTGRAATDVARHTKGAGDAAVVKAASGAAEENPERCSPALRGIQALLINLERRPDRFERCEARLRASCPWLRYARLSASDGQRDVIGAAEVASSWHTARNVVYQKLRAERKGWGNLDSYRPCHLELSPGERGCALSHVRAWRCCLELGGGGNQPLLVLEDDAQPTREFTQLLEKALAAVPADADLLYLGYSQAAEWVREVSPELVQAEYVWTTVAYVVWPKGARTMLSRLPIDQPVDNWMASLCANGSVQAYCIRPKIVHQADAWNVNSDVAHSDEHYWGHSSSSDIQHSDEFYWGNGSDIRHSDQYSWN